MALSGAQQRFVDELLKDPERNATAAYRRAYPNCKSDEAAAANAARLLRSAKVKAEIDRADAARIRRTQIDQDRVLKELASLALSDIGDVLDFSGPDLRLRPANEIPESARRAIASIKVKRHTEGQGEDAREVEVTEFRFWDKPTNLKDLGKHVGLFKERTPLEELIAGLPGEFGRRVGEALGRLLSGGRATPGGGAPDGGGGTGRA